MKRVCILLFGFLMFSGAARASVFIEPYGGYMTGNENISNTSYTNKGAVYGGRLGFQHMGFMIGGDYMGGSWTVSETPSATATPSDIGGFVGVEMHRFRIYGEYIFSASSAETQSGTSDTGKGTGFKLGIGFHLMPFLAINAEYLSHTFTKDNSGTLNPNSTDSMYGVTVSIPIHFWGAQGGHG